MSARALLLVCTLSGCALMHRGEPLRVRYFVPDTGPVHGAASEPAAAPARARGPKLRLGRITSGPQLGQRIMERVGAGEVRFHDTLRWTERPEAYLRRDLAEALFERGDLTRVVAGAGPTLDVELVAFEEHRAEGRHAAHFRAVLSVYGERELLVERTISETVDVKGSDESALMHAFSAALAQGVDAIVRATRDAMAGPQVPAGPAQAAPPGAAEPEGASTLPQPAG